MYQNFINLYRDKNRDKNKNRNKDIIAIPDFRKFLVAKYGLTYELVKIFSESLLSSVLKPQRLIEDNDNYYVAVDMFTNTYYICYSNLLMIDIDNKEDKEYKSIIELLPDNFAYRIYETTRGYHIFIINKKFSDKEDMINTMIGIGSNFIIDIEYVTFCYIRGCCVRLNKKENEENFCYKQIPFNNKIEEDAEIVKLVDKHIEYCKLYKDR
jgi:hypothetical protein